MKTSPLSNPTLSRRLAMVSALTSLWLGAWLQAADLFTIAETSMGTLGAFDGSNYLVGLVAGSDQHVAAQFVSPDGALVGPPVNLGQTGGFTYVAFDGTNHLLIWNTITNWPNCDVYGQFVSPAGALVGGPLAICTAPGLQEPAKGPFHFGRTNYLVVWDDKRNGQDNVRVYARLVRPNGAFDGTEMLISPATGNFKDSSSAFDGTNFLVVWVDASNFPNDNIQARFVNESTGALGPIFQLNRAPGRVDQLTGVAFGTTNYLVTWNVETADGWDLYGRLVSPAGALVGDEFPITTAPGSQTFGGPGFDGRFFVTMWVDGPGATNASGKIRGFDEAGQPVSTETPLFSSEGTDLVTLVGAMVGRNQALLLLVRGAGFGSTNNTVFGRFAPMGWPGSGFPLATNTTSTMVMNAAFDGSNYLVGFQGDLPSDPDLTRIVAQFVSKNGTVVGAPIVVAQGGGAPAVAFDGTNYLVTWPTDEDDLYGQLVSRSGGLVGSAFPIATGPEPQATHSTKTLAFDGSNYLAVWYNDPRRGSTYVDILGQFVSPAGQLVGGTLGLCTSSEWQLSPTLCFGRTNYLVAWPSRRSGSPELYDIEGRTVSKTGTLGAIFRLSQTPSPRHNPLNIGFDGTNFMAVWNRDMSPGDPYPSDWNIYGRVVAANGTALGNEFPLATAPGSQVLPAIGFDGVNYLISWHDTRSMLSKFRFFNPSGQAVGEEFHVVAPLRLQAAFALVAAFDGERFLALANLNETPSRFPYGDVWAALIPKSGRLPRLGSLGRPFPLQVNGRFGQSYAVQATTNLAHPTWTTLSTNRSGNGAFPFTDPQAGSLPRRFYRAVQVP